ncbi:MAG: ribbon-helix-helix domain-containing protein [Nitrososphaerota archaeon]
MQGQSQRHYPQVTITLPQELIHEIDKRRGLIPRSRFIRVLVEKALEIESRRPPEIAGGVSGGLLKEEVSQYGGKKRGI